MFRNGRGHVLAGVAPASAHAHPCTLPHATTPTPPHTPARTPFKARDGQQARRRAHPAAPHSGSTTAATPPPTVFPLLLCGVLLLPIDYSSDLQPHTSNVNDACSTRCGRQENLHTHLPLPLPPTTFFTAYATTAGTPAWPRAARAYTALPAYARLARCALRLRRACARVPRRHTALHCYRTAPPHAAYLVLPPYLPTTAACHTCTAMHATRCIAVATLCRAYFCLAAPPRAVLARLSSLTHRYHCRHARRNDAAAVTRNTLAIFFSRISCGINAVA